MGIKWVKAKSSLLYRVNQITKIKSNQIKSKGFIRKYTDKPNINGHNSVYCETANV